MTEKEAPPLTKSYDPGWNDPPTFSYEARPTEGKGITLTKRVAFPLKPMTESSSRTLLHEIPKEDISLRASSSSEDTSDESTTTEDDVSSLSLETLMKNFDAVIKEVYPDETNRKIGEIKRRLSIIENMWSGDRLSPSVKSKVFKLSIALMENNVNAADDLQRGLMVDHASTCCTWISGIRSLINAKRS